MSFFTAINCMDGRVQLPVINYIMAKYGVDYVDSVTEPGPVRILAAADDSNAKSKSILDRVKISLEAHKSKGVAIVGHYDCAGNPAGKDEQLIQLKKAKSFLKRHFNNVPIITLWVDENWQVERIE